MKASETAAALVRALNASGRGTWSAVSWRRDDADRTIAGWDVLEGAWRPDARCKSPPTLDPWCCEIRGENVPAGGSVFEYSYSGVRAVGGGKTRESAWRACLEDYCDSVPPPRRLPTPEWLKASSPEELELRLMASGKLGVSAGGPGEGRG